ncbi:MAG: ABC transporter permease [Salinivirgaceae bacterium]|nr:ABC transporter permease [Salinivirgaceae bacterium]
MKSILNLGIVKVIRRETTRLAKSKVLLFAAIVAPLLSMFLIMGIFSEGVVHNLSVTIVDHDNSALSRKVAQLVDASPIAKVSKSFDIGDAHSQMKKGFTDAIIVLPNSFERNAIKGNSPEIALYINNTNVIKGGLLYSGLYKTLATISGGLKVNVSVKKGLTEKQAVESAQPIRIDSHILFNPFINYSYFLTLGLLPLMLTILALLVSVYALGFELKYGTAKELLDTADGSVTIALLGKMLPYTFLFFMHAMVMNLILFKILGTPLMGSLTVLLFSELLLIITYQLLAILFLNVTSNMRLSLSLGSAYTLMALTFAGVTFPTLGMPLLAKIFSWFFPYTYWIKIFLAQTVRNQPFHTTIPFFLILMLFIIVSMFSFFGMKRKMSDSKYWGRS